ncbi:MAG: MCP four helix bundle domain-containing protein, partial [Nitrospirae bacterium]|nr:MCP four helix bundle domain-containing protein [Nitrospirota bacterium]
MTIGKKIIGGYAVVLVILVIVTASGFYSLKVIERAYAEFLDVEAQAILGATELKLIARDQAAQYRGLLLYPEEQGRFVNDLRESHQQFDAQIERMKNLSYAETGRRIIDEIEGIQKKYKESQERGIALIQRGKLKEAIVLSEQEALPLAGELRDKCGQYIELKQKRLADGRADVSRTLGRSTIVLISVSLLALISGLAIGFLLTRSITQQLRGAIAQLSSSSAEILTMTTQVASGAAETATAVSETTTTVEEVKQTAQVSSQKAKYVSETAQRASQSSQAGRKSVEGSIEGMGRIREQTETI